MMATPFAAQLRTIAQNSTHELDLRARRNAHAESILFPKDVAVKQDFDTIYTLCIEGFRELCALDSTFTEFQSNLFSAQSIKTERDQMNKKENEALNSVIDRCLTILGSKLLLKPGVKCLEWLVRRFKVQVHNTTSLLLAVLPWHEMAVWRNVLSIVPKQTYSGEWKFLGMYMEDAQNVPRSALIYAMTNNDGMFTLFNQYVVESAREGIAHSGLLQFWTGLVIEAIVSRLDAARSGRREVQRQRTDDLLLKVLPLLSEGFEIHDCVDLTTACFTLAAVLAGKADLDDRVLDSILQAVAAAGHHSKDNSNNAVVTICIIVQHKPKKSVPKAVLDLFMGLPNLDTTLPELRQSYQIDLMIEPLITSALSGVKRKNAAKRLEFVEKLLRFGDGLAEEIVSSAARSVLLRLFQLDGRNEVENTMRSGLIEMLQRLNEERRMSLILSQVFQQLNRDPSEFEALIGSTFAMVESGSLEVDTAAMEIDKPTTANTGIGELLEKLPVRTVDTISFLGKYDRHLFNHVVDCFNECCESAAGLQKFMALPLWKSSPSKGLILCSFLLRIANGPFVSSRKAAALQLLARYFEDVIGSRDAQILVPYVLSALADGSQNVRRSAAELLVRIKQHSSSEHQFDQKFGSEDLYEEDFLSSVKWIETNRLAEIIEQAFLPDLEECVLDESRIVQTVKAAIVGHDGMLQTHIKSSQPELKKSLRADLFDLLVSHTIATPLLKVKLNAIRFLQDISKVGNSSKSKALAPVLEHWSKYDEATVARITEVEQLSKSEADSAIAEIISAKDKDVIHGIIDRLEDVNSIPRSDFKMAIFGRLQKLWIHFKHDVQALLAEKMFNVAFRDDPILATGAQGVLRSISLASDILGTLLDQSTGIVLQLHHGDQHPKKKRRTSHGRDSVPPDVAKIIKPAYARITFALELIDDSNPENRPELLPALFDALASFRRLKQGQRASLSYLQTLCLSSMLAIVEAQKSLPKLTMDVASIRADLVTDSITSSESTQVQTTALLLAANLASITPDRVLHSVMPIFTFVGQSMISKDDEHSIHVVNQVIDQIIPALIGSLRYQHKNLIRSTSNLLASFTAAFDHIPQHRRISIYARLLDRMGPEDYAYVLLAMLAKRKENNAGLEKFLQDLLSELDISTQLLTFQKMIQLANNLLSQPTIVEEIFDVQEPLPQEERQELSKTMFIVGLCILDSRAIKSSVRKLHKLEENLAERLRQEIDVALRLIFSTIRDLRKNGNEVVEEAKLCLDALLALPSLTELFNILPQVLMREDIDEDMKPQMLRALASQLQKNPSKTHKTRVAAMALLERLTDMLQDSSEVAMLQALIICIDRISEIYGRKDIDKVTAAAHVVAGGHYLGSGDRRIEVVALLCLASMIEVLQEACNSIVPEMIPKMIEILRMTIQYKPEDEELHNAAFALVTAVVSHVPFMVSDDSLQALLVLSSMSAVKYSSTQASESRVEALSTIARKVDLTSVLEALLGEDIDVAREHPEDAQLEKLNMLAVAIESASKSGVSRNAEAISQLLLAHLDQRSRLLSAIGAIDDDLIHAVEETEHKAKEVTIQVIYKLNDSTFRPVFESWIDWAAKASDISEASRNVRVPLRQTSLFRLLTHFFDTLKSIVTSYASHVVPLASQILTDAESLIETRKVMHLPNDTEFWESLLGMLSASFTHDVDGFYSTPSHFEILASPLVSLLELASAKNFRKLVSEHVIPTIVSLATATMDVPSHHQTISHCLVQLRHSPSAAVRLASIRTFVTITSDEDVSGDFIANVVGIGSGEGEGARGVGGGGSVGEIMIYVNEMLEDDDEDVEREVRRWVQTIRERTGEDVFEV